jgi:hypothetical protein
MKNESAPVALKPNLFLGENALLADIRKLIIAARKRAAVAVNTEAVALNWQIGNRIKTDVLKNKRADYGKQVVKNWRRS